MYIWYLNKQNEEEIYLTIIRSLETLLHSYWNLHVYYYLKKVSPYTVITSSRILETSGTSVLKWDKTF